MVAQVAFPIAIPGLYDYAIPESMRDSVRQGTPVKVQLRSRELWGVVFKVVENSELESLKPILETNQNSWADSNSSLIRLYEWIASYYQCSVGKVFKPLIRKRFVEKKAKFVTVYRLKKNPAVELTKKQSEVLEKIRELPDENITRSRLLAAPGVSAHMIGALVKAGALEKKKQQAYRIADELRRERGAADFTLTKEQQWAVERIRGDFGTDAKPYLLHGITGSGKTLVYIELARSALERKEGVIILVPEISLTPQTIQRFRDAMGDVIAVIHSRMSEGERRDSIEEIVSGKKRVVIGVRSAIMAPMNNVGLIIVDEEHDGSYKQEDPEPRYHARDVAVMRGKFQGATVVLGSATPSFETYRNAISGKYELIRLQNRFGSAVLPHVKIIDMNKEHRDNNWTFLSRYLRDRIADTILQKRQVILLLNRRGFSVSLICKNCSHTYECPDCSVKLTYHKAGSALKCHQCGYFQQAPDICPKCKGEQIKYQGTGIQKAEEMLLKIFPMARIIRMDQDTTRRKGAHVALLSSFEREEADILLGTQMVAKGLNFPNVKLVGVLQADIGLHVPDFRSSERTFQLLAQVAGRAGRLDNSGEVVIQTYQPQDSCILFSQTHDYTGFFHQEIETRRTLRYPPFGRLARILVEAQKIDDVTRISDSIANRIRVDGQRSIELLGPAPAPLSRLRNAYRYSILLRSQSVREIQKVCRAVRKDAQKLPDRIKVVVNIDPLNML